MRLEVLPAKKGDCLLLHCGTAETPALVLIDGGPAGVWGETLKPRLLELRAERGLADGTPLLINLVIVSHVDDDHINGIIGLFEHIQDQERSRANPDFAVGRLWHNSFDDIVGNDEIGTGTPAARFGAASLGTGEEGLEELFGHGEALDAAKVLASVAQGDRLRQLAAALGIDVNPDFPGRLIQTGSTPDPDATLAVEFVVAGPVREDLEALQAAYDKWLRQRKKGDGQTSVLSALEDTSVANLSSVVLVARDANSTILLTGDARGDRIVAGLEATGELDSDGSIHVDVLKMPHHGSIRNIDDDFMTRVTGETYVLSGDGKHGNPDRETIELLLRSRAGEGMTLRFTYPLAAIDAERRREHEKEQRKRINKGLPGGPDWSDATDSLAAVLDPAPAGVGLTFG